MKTKPNLQKIAEGRAARYLYRHVDEIKESQYGQYKTRRSIEIGTEEGTVIIFADLDALVKDLGFRALHSKSGKSKMKDGLIECRVVSRVQHLTEEK